MRIQILTQYYEPEIGAPQVRLKAMAKVLVDRGHQVDVVTAMPNYPVGRIFDGYRRRLLRSEYRDGVAIRRVWVHAASGSGWARLLNYTSFALLALLPMARTKRPDIVLVESPPLFATVPALVDRLVRRRKFGLLVADLWPDVAIDLGLMPGRSTQRVMFALERAAYRWATIIAPTSDTQFATIRDAKGVVADKLHIVRNGVDLNLFAPGPGDPATRSLLAPNAERVILFAGTLGYMQGLDVIVDAIPIVRAAHPDVRFVFVGSGSEQARIRSRIEHEHITGAAVLDPRPLEEIAAMYRCVTAGITSLRDGPTFEGVRPAKIFPVMAAGLPVIYSGGGETARLIVGADAGVVAEPADPQALANACIAVLDDPLRAAEMGRHGRRLVEEEYSWDHIMGDFLAVLERCTARPGDRRRGRDRQQ